MHVLACAKVHKKQQGCRCNLRFAGFIFILFAILVKNIYIKVGFVFFFSFLLIMIDLAASKQKKICDL